MANQACISGRAGQRRRLRGVSHPRRRDARPNRVKNPAKRNKHGSSRIYGRFAHQGGFSWRSPHRADRLADQTIPPDRQDHHPHRRGAPRTRRRPSAPRPRRAGSRRSRRAETPPGAARPVGRLQGPLPPRQPGPRAPERGAPRSILPTWSRRWETPACPEAWGQAGEPLPRSSRPAGSGLLRSHRLGWARRQACAPHLALARPPARVLPPG